MTVWQKIHKYFFGPAAFHCSPFWETHEWRAPRDQEKFPVCVKCGKYCSWAKGYYTNSGTYLPPDHEALAVADMSRLENNPWDSRP